MSTEFKLSYTGSQINEKLGKIDSLATKSELPTKISQLTNDSGFLTGVPNEYVTETELNAKGYLTSYTESDPTVPDWAKAATKPIYTASEVGLDKVDNVKQYSINNPPIVTQSEAPTDTNVVWIDLDDNTFEEPVNEGNFVSYDK